MVIQDGDGRRGVKNPAYLLTASGLTVKAAGHSMVGVLSLMDQCRQPKGTSPMDMSTCPGTRAIMEITG